MPVSRKRRVPRVLKRPVKKAKKRARTRERTASGYVRIDERAPQLRVKVSQDIIDTAIRRDGGHCFIVKSVNEQFPQFTHVHADLQSIRMSDPERGLRYIYLTPPRAQAVLVLWDQGVRPRAFSFMLRGALTVAAKRTNRQTGRPVIERLSLGRQRFHPADSPRRSGPIERIGGRAPPIPRHPSASNKRQFGIRAFTADELRCFALDNLLQAPENSQ